jgi:hypothetical protein
VFDLARFGALLSKSDAFLCVSLVIVGPDLDDADAIGDAFRRIADRF